jgi:hypothetical protein
MATFDNNRGHSIQQCLLASNSTTTGLGNTFSFMGLAAYTTIKLGTGQDTILQPITSMSYRQVLATDCSDSIEGYLFSDIITNPFTKSVQT